MKEDKAFKEMMGKSLLQIQSTDFEEKVMEQIAKEEAQNKSFWRNIKLSWLFFWIGAFFGLVVAAFATDFKFTAMGIESKLPIYILQIIIVIVIASQFDYLFRITLKKKGM